MNSFFKDLLKISGSNTLAAVVNVIIGVIITRQLGPEGRGIYAAIIVVPALVLKFTEMGIRRSIIYHLGKKDFKDIEILSSLFVTILFTTVVGIGVSFYIFWFLDNPEFTLPLIVLAISRIPVRLIRRYAGGFFMGKQMYNISIFFRWMFLGLYLVATVLFLWVLDMGVLGALLAILISNLIVAILSMYRVLKQIPFELALYPKVLKSLLKYGLYYSAATFFMMLHSKLDILILGKLSSLEQIGFYSLAVAVVSNWQVPFAVGGVIISNSANSDDFVTKNEDIAKLTRITLLIGFLSYVVLFFLAPFIVRILYGNDFIPSVMLIRLLLPGVLFLILTKFMISRLAGEGKPYIFMFIAMPAVIINIVLNYLWIPVYDAAGAAMATNASYLFQFVVGIVVYSAIVKMPIHKIFSYRKSDFDFIKIIKKKVALKIAELKRIIIRNH